MKEYFKEFDDVDTGMHIYSFSGLGLYINLVRGSREETFYISNKDKDKDQLDRLIKALQDALMIMDAGQTCCAKHNKLFLCTRPKNHTGIHIATDGRTIYARWEE